METTMAIRARPLHDRIAVKRDSPETMSKGGIFLPHKSKEPSRSGEVLAVGPGIMGPHGKLIEMGCKVGDSVIFGIRLLESNRLIGSCQLHSINHVHRSAELQIRIGEPFQRGQGYGTEAVRLLLDFAFKDLNLHRVYLHVFSTNAAAILIYKKVGFVHEGLLRKAAHIDGAYVDVVVMGILRDEHVG